LKDQAAEGAHLGNLGLAYDSLGDYRRAGSFHEQSLGIVHEIGDPLMESSALYNASLMLDILGDRAEAIRLARAALIICESIEAPEAEEVRNQLKEWCGEI